MATRAVPTNVKEIQANRMVGWVEITAVGQTPPWRVAEFFHVNPTKAIGPELLLTRPGERVAVKVKTVGSKDLTENQEEARADLVAAGFEFYVWTPADQAAAFKRLSAPLPEPPPDTPTPRTRTRKKTNPGDNR